MQLAHVLDSGTLERPARNGNMSPDIMHLKTLGKPILAKTVRPNELATDRCKMRQAPLDELCLV